nr:helix-turn-helix transcriptional regulator [Streptomonospora sp. PA3]
MIGSVELIGRRPQLAVLGEAVQGAQAGYPQFVAVGGAAGIGKTFLLEHFAENLAAAGARVVRGAGIELGSQGLALVPVRAMVRDLVRQVGRERVAELAPDAAALAPLLPRTGGPQPDDRGGPARLFDALTALVERLGQERTVLLAVDDLHWADRSTLDLLRYLVRTLRDSRVVTAAAYRSDDIGPDHPLVGFLAELGRLPGAHRIDLPPLGRAETAGLIGALAPERFSERRVDEVFRRTGGNTLAVRELAAEDVLPPSLADLVLRRVRRLDDRVRELVRLAALSAAPVSHDLIAAVAGLDEAELIAGLRTAVDARLLVPSGDSYAFAHALLREAVRDDLLPAQARRYHRRYARALQSDPSLVAPERRASEAAHHWYGAGDLEQALPALLEAADAAERLNARAEQARLLERALRIAEHDRPALLRRAVEAAAWAGEDVLALDLIERALAEGAPGTPGEEAMLLALRALTLLNLRRGGAAAAAEEALGRLEGVPAAEQAPVLDLAGAVFMADCRWERARDIGEQALRLAADNGDAALAANARITLGTALTRIGDRAVGLSVLHSVREECAERGDTIGSARARVNLAIVEVSLGRYEAAVGTAEAGLESCRAAGLERTLGALLTAVLATALNAMGRYARVEEAAALALRKDPASGFAGVLLALSGEAALRRGDLPTARERCSLARPLVGGEAAPPVYALPYLRVEAEVALAENRPEDARRIVVQGLDRAARAGNEADAWPLLPVAARAAVREGDASLRERVRATAGGLRRDTPPWAAFAAECAAELGDARWSAAAAAWKAVADPYREAYATMRTAQEEGRGKDRGGVPALLRSAAATARDLGAAALLQEIEVLARGAHVVLEHEAPAAKTPAERLGLTAREAEVLRLVAEGSSNRRIAAELFISVKTASVHVSRILGKLGAATRGEAAATAHRLGLFEP